MTLTYSCSDTITRDEPIFQTMIDNDIYRSQEASASLDEEGSLIIESGNIMLKTEFDQPGVYVLAEQGVSLAKYKTLNDSIYTSQHSKIDGVIEIIEVHERGYDGRFNFNLVNPLADTVVMHKGTFFNVPLDNSGDTDQPGDLPPEYMLATIDGTSLETQTITRSANDNISITGDFDGAEINISYPEALEPGTYNIADQADLNMNYTENETIDVAVTGQLTINAVEDGFYSGTFNFTTESGLFIESGEFAVQ